MIEGDKLVDKEYVSIPAGKEMPKLAAELIDKIWQGLVYSLIGESLINSEAVSHHFYLYN